MVWYIVLGALGLLNLIAFGLMGWDKRQASIRGWRVPEKTLLGAALVGGSLGVYSGMRLFRHKTLHKQFSWGVPFIIAAQIALAVYLFVK